VAILIELLLWWWWWRQQEEEQLISYEAVHQFPNLTTRARDPTRMFFAKQIPITGFFATTTIIAP